MRNAECGMRIGAGGAATGGGQSVGLSDICRWEAEHLGFMAAAHPLDFVRAPADAVAAADMRSHAGRRVRMVGWLISAKLLSAKASGRRMKMLSLEDRTGTFEAVLFPPTYARLAARTLTCGPYLLEGKVDVRLGSATLDVKALQVLRPEARG